MDSNLLIYIYAVVITLYFLFTTKNKDNKNNNSTWFSKFTQVSKFITLILLIMSIITWFINLVMVVKSRDVNNLPILNDCTNNTVQIVLPYFSLTCVERVTNSDVITKITTVLKKGA